MAGEPRAPHDLSARRIIGFACNQAFVFFLFYMGADRTVELGGFAVERVDLLATLLFMVVGLAAVRACGAGPLNCMFSRPLLYVYAVVAAAGSLLPDAVPAGGVGVVVAEGALTGVPCALLLTAWGRAFGAGATRDSVPEVFLGSLVGALVCLLFSLAAGNGPALLLMRLLPLASVVNIAVPVGQGASPSTAGAQNGRAYELSAKVLAGTLLFGMAAGLMELYRVDPGPAAVSHYQVSMVLFGAFLIGGLTLLLSDGFGRGAALNKSYRLAVFVMMMGVLLVPWPVLAESVLPGEAVVLAGYLGLEAVLISLFIVLAQITETDCALSFSRGFSALFVGELVGALLAGILVRAGGFSADSTSYAIVILAGAIVLLSYVFLFTERDFDALSHLVTERDSLESACVKITAQFGLSNRESEILAFALRGRTAERIAQELVISKSTVDTHLRRIYAKCAVHSRQELLDLAEGLR